MLAQWTKRVWEITMPCFATPDAADIKATQTIAVDILKRA